MTSGPIGRDPNAPCALYRIYDAERTLLYVGESIDLPQRLKNHSVEKLWWSEKVSTIEVEWFPNGRAAEEAEAAAIKAERPLHNVQSNGGRWSEARDRGITEALTRDIEAARAAKRVEATLTRHFVATPGLMELTEPWLADQLAVSKATIATAKRKARAELGIVPPAVLRSPNFLANWNEART